MTELPLTSMSPLAVHDLRFSQTQPLSGAQPSPSLFGRDTQMAALLERVLDEIDYGVLVVAPHHHVSFANRAARTLLAATDAPCRMECGLLRPLSPQDQSCLDKAIDAAALHGRRSLVRIGLEDQPILLAAVPLAVWFGAATSDALRPAAGPAVCADVLLLFSRRQMCEALSIEFYARAYGLTHAESMVLGGLCRGEQPSAIATGLGVAISTVRTQVSCIRQKTGASSIRELVQQVSVLPPIVSAVHTWGAH